MSDAHDASMMDLLSAEEEMRLRHALDQAGCRFTRQRAAVFAYLKSVASHPTAEEVYRAVQTRIPHISLATVYNCLEALVSSSLAQKLTLGDGRTRYDGRTDQHLHLRDHATGQVRDLPVAVDLNALHQLIPELGPMLRSMGFEITDYRLELLGRFQPFASPLSEPPLLRQVDEVK